MEKGLKQSVGCRDLFRYVGRHRSVIHPGVPARRPFWGIPAAVGLLLFFACSAGLVAVLGPLTMRLYRNKQ